MGFRFRKSVKVLPGVRVNVGKRGASVTVGQPGASVNVGPQGTHANVGAPGTGMSYRQRLGGPPTPRAPGAALRALAWIVGVVLVAGLCVGLAR